MFDRLDVSCWECHHSAVLDVDHYADDVPVPWFGPRLVCTYRGIIGCDARPNWADQGSRMVAGAPIRPDVKKP